MDIEVLQGDLVKACGTAIRFISTRNTLPILGNFLLKAEKTKLIVSATNLEMSINLKLGAKVEKEGAVTVPAKLFLDIVTNLGPGQIKLVLNKDELKITGQGFKGSLATTPANDFPQIPESVDAKESFSVSGKSLRGALSKVLFSAGSDDTRPILTGVLFAFSDSSLSLVASDGFRLSQKSIKLETKIKERQIVIPKASLLELIKLGSYEESLVFELKETDNQLIMKIENTIISTRLLEGNFPDFEKIIPKSSATKVMVAKDDLSRGVKLAGSFAHDEGNVIKMKITETIQLESESAKAGKEVTEIEAKVDGGALDISFNYKFIEAFLAVVEGDSLEINLTDGSSPAIFVDPLDKAFLHLIMPVKIQG